MSGNLKPGTVLNSTYEIIRVLGEGGMGIVYEATHLTMRHSVAIKVLGSNLIDIDSVRHRFFEEGQIQAQLRHPNLVHVYDILEDANMLAIVMEYVPGRSLRDFIYASERPVNEEQGVGIIVGVLEGLSVAHDVGIIHRDIKPDNLILAQHETALVPKITDFGIAKDIGAQGVTQMGTILGTPFYMSPEQAIDGRDVDARSDIYALGVTMFELFTQELPFEYDDAHKVVQAHVIETPPSPALFRSDLDPKLVEVILKCLEKEREDRYPNCSAMITALKNLRRVPLTLNTPVRRLQPETISKTVVDAEIGFLREQPEGEWSEFLGERLDMSPPKLGQASEDYLSKALGVDDDPIASEPTVSAPLEEYAPTPLPGIEGLDKPAAPLPPPKPRPQPTAKPEVVARTWEGETTVKPAREIQEPIPQTDGWRQETVLDAERPLRKEALPLLLDEPDTIPPIGSKPVTTFRPRKFDALRWSMACFLLALGVTLFQVFPYGECVYQTCDAYSSSQSQTFRPAKYDRLSVQLLVEATSQESFADALDLGFKRCVEETRLGRTRVGLNWLIGLFLAGAVGLRVYHRFT